MRLKLLYLLPLFFVFGYFPLIFFEYIPQDQLRIFNYSGELTGIERFFQCSKNTMGGMFLTGRPLVWISECIEHALVDEIFQIKYFRIPNLIILTICFSLSS